MLVVRERADWRSSGSTICSLEMQVHKTRQIIIGTAAKVESKHPTNLFPPAGGVCGLARLRWEFYFGRACMSAPASPSSITIFHLY